MQKWKPGISKIQCKLIELCAANIHELGLFCCLTIACECIQYPNKRNHHNLSYEDTDTLCRNIAVLRKLNYFELICNYLSFVYATITILGIFLTLSMTLLERTWPGKSNGIGFRVIGSTIYTL
jgi:hypothetical protein